MLTLALRTCSGKRVLTLHARVRYYGTPVNLPVPNKKKVWDSADEAVKDVKSGDILLCGGTSIDLSYA